MSRYVRRAAAILSTLGKPRVFDVALFGLFTEDDALLVDENDIPLIWA